jgi:hypothetical protein
MWTARILLITLSLLCVTAAQKTRTYTRTYVTHYLEDFPGPQVFQDMGSRTTLYVETDGRHVSAISRDGKLLWTKDPYKDADIPPYRTEKPQNRLYRLSREIDPRRPALRWTGTGQVRRDYV